VVPEDGSVSVVVGASGAIGARLTDALLAAGSQVRVAGRSPDALARRWPDADTVEIDVLRPETIAPALDGADTAFYLVHAMGGGEAGFAERDRLGARAFARGATEAGVRRIVYLGGLGSSDDELSVHLSSRHETGRELATGDANVVELRAGMVVAPDSASFRMVHDLVRRLPVMVTPKWVDTRSQPIAVDDVVAYLLASATVSTGERHAVIEIGGADVLTYRDMMDHVAAIEGRHVSVVMVPVLTPRLSSWWCGLVTSVPPSIARPLIDGLVNETVVHDDSARRLFPDVRPVGFDEAVARAVR
jgi:uncharacterized protein YbjT (DUF2867 family)